MVHGDTQKRKRVIFHREEYQLINITGVIELENDHFATCDTIINSGNVY